MHSATQYEQAVKELRVGDTKYQVRDKLRGWYWDAHGSDLNVTIDLFFANGTKITNLTTENIGNATKKVINLYCRKYISTEVFTQFTDDKTWVTTAKDVVLSSKPLKGNYHIKCPVDGVTTDLQTNAISVYSWANTVKNAINANGNACMQYYKDTISVTETYEYPYRENGRGFYLYFHGIDATTNPPQFSIGNNTITEATNTPDATFGSFTLSETSTILQYDVIPYEWIHTIETKPQVLVTVGGLPAICVNLTCDYEYVDANVTVTGGSYDTSTKILNVTGTNLPTLGSEIQMLKFAQAPCALISNTATNTSFECKLEREPVCGKYAPELVTHMGASNASTFPLIQIDCQATNVTT